jgi:osmoprotectant transport system ATP-binding protein
MPVPAIEFRDVTFTRPGGRIVIQRLSLSIVTGETLALVGRSGAGKSTILKLVNRLLAAESGTVLVDGRDTREWNPIQLRRRVGYVLQEVGLFPHMTVADNVGTVPRLLGWPATRRRDRAEERERPVEDHLQPAAEDDADGRRRRPRVGRADGERGGDSRW